MRTAFVTGATRGTGRAIATALARNGWRVYALGRDRRVLDELRADHGINPLAVDLTDRDELGPVITDLRVDALIHAPLRWPDTKTFLGCDESEIDMTIEVNLSAVLRLTHAMLPAMTTARDGAVVFVTPDAGPDTTAGGSTVEATVAAALGGFARALRAELAGSGISIDCVAAPGDAADRVAARIVALLDSGMTEQQAGPDTAQTINR